MAMRRGKMAAGSTRPVWLFGDTVIAKVEGHSIDQKSPRRGQLTDNIALYGTLP